MKSVLKILSLIVVFLVSLTITLEVIAARPQRADVGLWLARSCVGEAGFASADSGECGAILHVYKKRALLAQKSILWIAKRYSAALKQRGGAHPNLWVLGLNRELERPRHWSRHLSWEAHQPRWAEVLDVADNFLAGQVKDPLPKALHFGGSMDRYRLPPSVWDRIKGVPFRNTFYRRRK